MQQYNSQHIDTPYDSENYVKNEETSSTYEKDGHVLNQNEGILQVK